jgi:hypothetical protein
MVHVREKERQMRRTRWILQRRLGMNSYPQPKRGEVGALVKSSKDFKLGGNIQVEVIPQLSLTTDEGPQNRTEGEEGTVAHYSLLHFRQKICRWAPKRLLQTNLFSSPYKDPISGVKLQCHQVFSPSWLE